MPKLVPNFKTWSQRMQYKTLNKNNQYSEKGILNTKHWAKLNDQAMPTLRIIMILKQK